MKAGTLLMIAAAIAVPLAIAYRRWALMPAGAENTSPKVVKMVETTLHEHQGEEKPFVQAFEEALAGERA